MKYLILFAVLAVVYLLWRSQQRRARAASRPPPVPPTPPTPAESALPQDMVSCPVCAVHLPRGEAVADPQGRLYCSPEHRAGASR